MGLNTGTVPVASEIAYGSFHILVMRSTSSLSFMGNRGRIEPCRGIPGRSSRRSNCQENTGLQLMMGGSHRWRSESLEELNGR